MGRGSRERNLGKDYISTRMATKVITMVFEDYLRAEALDCFIARVKRRA